MSETTSLNARIKFLDPLKFKNPDVTAKGEPRASVALKNLETLWFNTGTLCNITCVDCYIESSPANDRLAYFTAAEMISYLNEAEDIGRRPQTIGFTGGEPFMNPDIAAMLEGALERGYDVLYDDRELSAGVKFADADLLGVPLRVTIGAKGLDRGIAEVRSRASGETREVALATLLKGQLSD